MKNKEYIISPSILSADFARLGQEVSDVVDAGANWIHFDVMDNHYVPNLTFGPMICKAIKPYAKHALMDVHLMVSPVDDLINQFATSGADLIVFHPEASKHVDRSLSLIKGYGLKAGLALNPATPLSVLDYVMHKIDLVLLMSVNPGFGGQAFIDITLDKVKELKAKIDKSGRDIIIQVDGGVKVDNIAKIAACGASAFVAGSAIFSAEDYANVISEMRKQLAIISNTP